MGPEDNHSPEKNFSEDLIESEEKADIPKTATKEIKKKNSEPIKLIIVLMIVVGIAGYFSGSYFANPDSDLVTKAELADVIAELESKMGNTQQIATQPSQPLKISVDDDPVRGDPNAPITIIEFSDFQCPFCLRFHTQTLPLIEQNYISTGQVNFVYRDFPIQSIHPNAFPAAVAAECANEQGKFWEFHDTLFEKQNDWSRLDSNTVISTFSQYATDIGLEKQQFDSCLDTGKYLKEVQGDLNDGRDYGVTGTPGFFIGNDEIGFVKLSGAQPFEAFQRVIDSQLNT